MTEVLEEEVLVTPVGAKRWLYSWGLGERCRGDYSEGTQWGKFQAASSAGVGVGKDFGRPLGQRLRVSVTVARTTRFFTGSGESC